ncbi:MAG: peptide ABC transporter substrate-binding protein [Planctomycetota bacterium]|nr:MAG: peptide ABC transporter substrate-binding protein [Planctomycetota bacterium]
MLLALLAAALAGGCGGGGGGGGPAITVAIFEGQAIDPVRLTGFGVDLLARQLFAPLFEFDLLRGELRPVLVESTTVTADGLVWTLVLREALWSDASPITAADVEFSIKRALDPVEGAQFVTPLYVIEGAQAFHQQDPGAVSVTAEAVGVRATGPRTLEVRLRKPAAYLPGVLSLPNVWPVPRAALERHGERWTEPEHLVVSGAYRLERIEPGRRFVLVKNPRYFEAGAVAIRRVTFEEVPLEGADVQALRERWRAGELDAMILHTLFGSFREQQADPLLGPTLRLMRFPATFMMVFNTAAGATRDRNVRRALSAAIDRRREAAEFSGLAASAQRTVAPPGVAGAVPPQAGIGLRGHQGLAQAFRAAAGAAFPQAVTITQQPAGSRAAERIAAQWRALFGPELQVDVASSESSAEHFERLFGPDPQAQPEIMLLGWVADYPDAFNFLGDLHVALNPSRLERPDFVELVEQAGAETDPQVRAALFAEAERILCEDEAAVAPISAGLLAVHVQPRLDFQDSLSIGRWRLR